MSSDVPVPQSSDRLGRVRSLIDSRLADPLDLDVLSREACLSRFHFVRAFRRSFFDTPHQYVLRRRLERARELLAHSDLSVTDVCFEVGFESLGTFSATFHRVVGWSPSMYRARCRDQALHPRRYVPSCCWTMMGYGATRDGGNGSATAGA